ncbi:hypothetical protein CUR178_07173 [Leishmania enriettii]|uniref:Tyrosine specific protein phosphatases domain-containing protein n=1 Tax=Leishmania enriettii TaxID=5663 RepID=A0A836KT14_LEIEN|nr:hypothetical protein CUR178_07173 [Leishmania enriettii]
MPPRPLDPTPAAPAAVASTLLTLQRLLDTQQASAILPGLLYFASTGESLSTPLAASAVPAATAAHPSAAADSKLPSATAEAVSTMMKEAIHNFYFKENPFIGGVVDAGCKLADTGTIPSPRAAVGQDAVFVSLRGVPPYLYRPFFADFGPLDMGCCVHFARRLCELLRTVTEVGVCASPASAATLKMFDHGTGSSASATAHTQQGGPRQRASALSCSAASGCSPGTARPVVVCASLNAQERVNTACLVGAFCVLCLGWSAAATWYRGFVDVYPGFLAYRDASQGVSNYPLSLLDVWAGLEQGVALGLVDVRTFDLPAFLEGKQQDYSWVIPRRFLAMSSPQDDKSARTAEVFARRLRPLGVRLVVRLNDNLYNPSPLLRLGIRHVDLPYADGSVPTDAMLLRFLRAVEEHFGETVMPVSLRQWWSMPSSSTATVARAASASTSAPSVGAGRWKPGLQSCSLMPAGTCRGMPDAWRAFCSLASSTQAKRPNSAHVNASQGHISSALAPGEKGAVAVHCLAGLGRTGTMLAVYMMRHYGFTARAVIGWLRLCRPGSITGIQQQYLDTMERRLRPPPHMLTVMQLNSAAKRHSASGTERQLALPSRFNCLASSLALSSLSALLNPAVAAPPGGGGNRVVAVDKDQLSTAPQTPLSDAATARMHSIAAAATFQTHGSVVADARPVAATSVVSGHIKRGDTGQTNAIVTRANSEAGSYLGTFPDLAASVNLSDGNPLGPAGVCGLTQQRRQLQMRRFSNSSTATLSLSTIQPAGTALDVVARMPVLGDDSPQNGSAITAPLKQGALAADNNDSPSIRPSPHVGDYKYASTYFAAMEEVVGMPRVYAWSQFSAATSTVRGESRATHGVGVRPATANTSCNTTPLGACRSGGDSSGSESGKAKATRAAPASVDTVLRRRKGLISALQRQRPHTATAAARAGSGHGAKQWQSLDRLGGAINSYEAGTHAPGDTPPHSPPPREAATCVGGRRHGKSTHRASLGDTIAGGTASAGLCGGVTLNTPHPPAAPMHPSPPWIDGGVKGLSDGLLSPQVQSPSSSGIPATMLPMWGRPTLRS